MSIGYLLIDKFFLKKYFLNQCSQTINSINFSHKKGKRKKENSNCFLLTQIGNSIEQNQDGHCQSPFLVNSLKMIEYETSSNWTLDKIIETIFKSPKELIFTYLYLQIGKGCFLELGCLIFHFSMHAVSQKKSWLRICQRGIIAFKILIFKFVCLIMCITLYTFFVFKFLLHYLPIKKK